METGVVEKIEFTQGGMGNQWTTIDGVTYATWWDYRTKNWNIGDVVSFVSGKAIFFDNDKILQATNIKLVSSKEEVVS